MERLVGVFGLGVLLALAYLCSTHRKQINFRLVIIACVMQIVLAILVLGVPIFGLTGPLRPAFNVANDLVIAVLNYTNTGSAFIFGDLANSEKLGFVFAFQVLPTIIFMSSLMGVLYYLGVMQKIVSFIAKLMQKFLGISGAESLSAAANIFVGQTEAPLVIRPYIDRLTRSELLAVMIGGMATVAGGVLAAYVGMLKDRIPDIAGHLLTASVMSAPAAIAIAKIMMPETETPETLGQIPKDTSESEDHNLIEAAARGAGDGLKLALNVGAMLLAFIALIAMLDGGLKYLGEVIAFSQWGSDLVPAIMKSDSEPAVLSMSLILGWLFAPLAFIMGIPWAEAAAAGTMLGEKLVLNEFYAYLSLTKVSELLSERTVIILSYALCGFANFSSIAIQIGGIGGIAPKRQKDLAQLGIKSVIGGSLAAFMTATIAGLLL